MRADEVLRERRDDILRIAACHGARNVRVFGSVARGDATNASDVDLVVDLAPGRSLFDHAAFVVELEEALGCRVDVATERGLRERIRQRVLDEAVPL